MQQIRREMIYKYGWVSEEEFTRFWTLCTLVPGINLIALAILIGRKLAGWRGVAATLTGMLLPSVLITTLLTAGFTSVQSLPAVQSMLRGVIPATAGLMLVVAIQMGGSLFRQSRKEGPASLGASLFLLALAALLLSLFHLAVWLVLVLSALGGLALFTGLLPVSPKEGLDRS